MKRLKTLPIMVLSLGLSLPVSSMAQDNTVTFEDITDKIKMLVSRAGNIGLFMGADGTFMIDDKFADMTAELSQAITDAGGQTPAYLINTHWHYDHTGGNEHFGTEGSMIVAHQNVRERMSVDNTIAAFNAEVPAAEAIALPAITYTNKMHFYLNGDELDIIHLPNAHTDGDSVVMFNSANVLHTGDIFFNGFFPFIDTQHGGSLAGTIAAVDSILAMINDDTKIIPGHGPLASKADLQSYRDMLAQAHETLSSLKAEGKSLAEVNEMDALGELDEEWGKVMFNAKKWTAIVWGSITPE